MGALGFLTSSSDEESPRFFSATGFLTDLFLFIISAIKGFAYTGSDSSCFSGFFSSSSSNKETFGF